MTVGGAHLGERLAAEHAHEQGGVAGGRRGRRQSRRGGRQGAGRSGRLAGVVTRAGHLLQRLLLLLASPLLQGVTLTD